LRTIFCIVVFVPVIALQAPAAGWSIPSGGTQLGFVVEQPQSPWTAVPVPSPVVTAEVQAQIASTQVLASGAWVENAEAAAVRNGFVKTAADLKILDPQIHTGPYATPVPEPAGIAGLSTGLFGLLFYVRRAKKRS
jgi:hypothetical protein